MRSDVWRPFAIGIGTNLGDRSGQIRVALAMLERSEGIRDLRASAPIDTAPVLPDGERSHHPSYLNAVAIGETRLSPTALMSRLLAIETCLGRRRSGGCLPRTLDLDLLLMGDLEMDEPGLRLPHPRFKGRDFVTNPLRELLGEVEGAAAAACFGRYVGDVD